MMRNAPAVVLFFLPALVFGQAAPPPVAAKAPPTVYVGGGLDEAGVIAFTATVAAADPTGVVLIDSPSAAAANAVYLKALHPTQIIPVGDFAGGVDGLQERLGQKTAPPLAGVAGLPTATWHSLFPQADRVVVCPLEPRRLLLESACLAAALKAPLAVLRGAKGETAVLKDRLSEWKTKEILAVASAAETFERPPNGVRVTALEDEDAVFAAHVRRLALDGPVRNLVVLNPADGGKNLGSMSLLAPWVAARRRAAVLMTDDAGTDTRKVVRAALKNPDLPRADTLVVLANLRAIPVEKRPNPVNGKDAEIEMEPMTPEGEELFSFAVGRLFHHDPALLSVVLSRQALLPAPGKEIRRALVVSNPGGGLPLLETFSRHTAHELKNAGYDVTALFEDQAEKDKVRKLVPEQDIFLWEGHYKTLTDEFGFLKWTEPLPPSLCFLQSCLALREEEAEPLFERGAIAVVGSSTRTYSGTGGAFSLAFFNALLYEDETLGGSLRQAKNYLLAYSLLKEKRLGDNAKLTGVNVRSSWAFTLWGDPTLRLPSPARPKESLEEVTHEVQRGKTILVNLPESAYPKVKVGKFEAQMRPNARLAGLLRSSEDNEDVRQLVPFVFVEVRLPNGPPGQTPELSSKLPDKNWVWLWDGRRKTGCLLITPRPKDKDQLKFTVRWEE